MRRTEQVKDQRQEHDPLYAETRHHAGLCLDENVTLTGIDDLARLVEMLDLACNTSDWTAQAGKRRR